MTQSYFAAVPKDRQSLVKVTRHVQRSAMAYLILDKLGLGSYPSLLGPLSLTATMFGLGIYCTMDEIVASRLSVRDLMSRTCTRRMRRQACLLLQYYSTADETVPEGMIEQTQ